MLMELTPDGKKFCSNIYFNYSFTCTFWLMEIGTKATHKMLVKLNPVLTDRSRSLVSTEPKVDLVALNKYLLLPLCE